MREQDIPPPGDGQLMREASFWFARMRGPEADASRADFEAWMARGALHRGAYNRAAEIFAMGKLLLDDPMPALDTEPASTRLAPARHKRRYLALAFAAALLAAAVAAIALASRGSLPATDAPSFPDLVAEAPGIFAAPADAARRVELADGSVVTLAPGARVELRFNDDTRRILLAAGTARFEVRRHDRPFVVVAGGGSVTARGTKFEVALSPARGVRVHLYEGAVDVVIPARSAGARSIRRLRPGEQIAYAAMPGAPVAGADTGLPERQTRAAVEEFAVIPLGELVARANRGAARPIRLASPELAGRRVSGRLRLDDNALLAGRLAQLFDLSVETGPGGEIVLSVPHPR